MFRFLDYTLTKNIKVKICIPGIKKILNLDQMLIFWMLDVELELKRYF